MAVSLMADIFPSNAGVSIPCRVSLSLVEPRSRSLHTRQARIIVDINPGIVPPLC